MIRYEKDIQHIVTLTLDMEGRDQNILNHAIVSAFMPVLKLLKEEKAAGALKGVIITSDKKTFLSGGDWEMVPQNANPKEIFDFTQSFKQFFRDLESPGVPVVAAINGDALGAGFELTLACHYRVCINDPNIQLGMTEVKYGLMPGNGGVLRLMWILGIERAFPLLARGHRHSPSEALKAGLVDELATSNEDLLYKAKKWLLEHREGRRVWDTHGGSIPGGSANDTKTSASIAKIAAEIMKSNLANYPAPKAILNTMSEGSKVDFDTASRIESRYYAELLSGPIAKNMVNTFYHNKLALKSGLERPKGYGKFRPRKIGIIGAGRMGSGIAFACLKNGMQTVVKDVSMSIAGKAHLYAMQQMDAMIEKGTITEIDKAKWLSKLEITDNAAAFKECDLVIEAVFENEMIKSKVTEEAAPYLDEYAVFATNTISIPIGQLSKTLKSPHNYVGLHFFHPVEEMPLVEIVRGADTSDETIAKAFDFVRSIRKTPIVVKDIWGFYAMRVQNTYILEGIAMLLDGVPPALIENLGVHSGMPKGPLEMADEIGLEIVIKYENQAAAHYGPKYIQHPAIDALKKMMDEAKRFGKDRKAGFYEYENGEKVRLWRGLMAIFPLIQMAYDNDEIKQRLLTVQVLEAVWCMTEKVIEHEEAANIGSVYGWGFPGYTGGVINYIHHIGKAHFIEQCKDLLQKQGPRYKVPALLKKLEKAKA